MMINSNSNSNTIKLDMSIIMAIIIHICYFNDSILIMLALNEWNSHFSFSSVSIWIMSVTQVTAAGCWSNTLFLRSLSIHRIQSNVSNVEQRCKECGSKWNQFEGSEQKNQTSSWPLSWTMWPLSSYIELYANENSLENIPFQQEDYTSSIQLSFYFTITMTLSVTPSIIMLFAFLPHLIQFYWFCFRYFFGETAADIYRQPFRL